MVMNKQSGSALFVILVAVALFAALAYAFMQGNRGSTAIMTDEAAKAYANEIIAYGNDVKNTVKRLQLRGCDDSQLNFANTEWKRKDGSLNMAPNPAAPADGSCDIFTSNGGGLTAKVFQKAGISESLLNETANYWQPGSSKVSDEAIGGFGTNEAETYLSIQLVSPEVCKAINKVANNYDGIPVDVGSGAYYYEDIPEFMGRTVTCTKWSPSSWGEVYYIRYVLISR